MGESIPVGKLLTEYSTGFGHAYEQSQKAIDDQDPDKSKTLEKAIDRLLKECPWSVNVKFKREIKRPEYNSFNSTITLNPDEPVEQQIGTFAHEVTHATHQYLSKLFLGDKLSKEDYVDLKRSDEIDAYEAQIKVLQERAAKTPGANVLAYRYIDKDGDEALEDLCALYAKKGRTGLAEFFKTARNVMIIDGKSQLGTYADYFASLYASYADDGNFRANAKTFRDLVKSNPAWAKALKNGF